MHSELGMIGLKTESINLHSQLKITASSAVTKTTYCHIIFLPTSDGHP
jgi:hypothetical protein